MIPRIGLIVGSLRKDSLNRQLARALIELGAGRFAAELVEIGDLPLYNADDEDPPAAAVQAFRHRIASLDGVLFVTPEYNRGVPGVLKNAVDIGSRPYGQSVWQGKPAGVVSLSVGAQGGFGANHQLRQSLVVLDMPTMPQPEVYIGHAEALFDARGRLTDADTLAHLRDFLEAFGRWVDQHRA